MNFIEKALTKVFGSANERLLKQLWPIVAEINAIEPSLESLTDDKLREKTVEFRNRLAADLEEAGPDDSPERRKLEQHLLESLLPEAFACVREASRRATGMRHFDVQLIGGMVLNRGMIAEMRTGEGKTLVATLPVYLNALLGRGVHVVTVNDYLARRDAEWMGPSTASSVSRSASFKAIWTTRRAKRHTTAISPTEPTTSLASTIFVTT